MKMNTLCAQSKKRDDNVLLVWNIKAAISCSEGPASALFISHCANFIYFTLCQSKLEAPSSHLPWGNSPHWPGSVIRLCV